MTEPFSGALTALETKRKISGIFISTLGSIKEFHDKHDILNLAAARYKNKLESLIDNIRILGMERPVPLTDLFIKVNVLDKLTAKQIMSVDQLEADLQKDTKGFGRVSKNLLGMNLIRNSDYVMVLGKPGSGKTTFLKYIALSALRGNECLNSIPVFISLKQMSDSDVNIQRYVEEQFAICGFNKRKDCIERFLNSGKLTLLFDGLDEVEYNQDILIGKLQDFVNKYSNCKYVISCRSAAYNYMFSQFTDVEIADFEMDQIEGFVTKWFHNKNKKKRLFLDEIKHTDNKSILDLARSPLLLTLLCINYDDGMSFPVNRADLYDDAIEALLKKWDTHRQIKRSEVYRILSINKKKKLLQQLAINTFQKNMYFFKKDQAVDLISQILDKMGTGLENPELDGNLVLGSIEEQHGIVVQRAKNVYSFSHLTFQEYFCAAAICENTNSTGRQDLIKNHLFDDRYREIFLLVTSKLAEADDFLTQIRENISTIPIGINVSAILSKIVNIISPVANYPLPIKRTIALRVIFDPSKHRHYLGRTNVDDPMIRWAFNATDNLLKRTLDVYKAVMPDKYDPEEAEIKTLDLGMKVARDEIDEIVSKVGWLNTDEFKHFAKYLKSSKLLIDCMSVDAIISKKTKQQLIESFLLER